MKSGAEEMMSRKICYAVILLSLAFFSSVSAATSDEFFKGKTIRIVVGNSAGGAMDDWARFLAPILGKHIPGNPDIVVQNMPGAGGVIAANYVYSVGKPDGLTLGLVGSSLYIEQLLGHKEVKFDWPKFSWIGSPEQISNVLFMRADGPYKTLEDIRKATEPPRCASLARTGLGYYLIRILEEGLGLKFNIVAGYGGGGEMNLAIEKGEAHCRAGTSSAYVGREPTRTWMKKGFVRALAQSGATRYAKLPDVPTIYELLDAHKAPEATKRVARVVLASGDLGRPFIASPGTPPERVKVLRAALTATLNDNELLAGAKKRDWDLELTTGEELESLSKSIMVQPPDVIERVKKMVGN
jgi:tripartite-type tricarboxylate transporter receptor subunit TctC